MFAQKAETVYGFAVDRHDEQWYMQQLELWKSETAKNAKNAVAWYNYYNAARALRNLLYDNKEKQKKYRELCSEIPEKALKQLPESFEANHMMWREGGNDKALFPYLEKANRISPDDPRAAEDLATWYEVAGNKREYSHFCKVMYATGNRRWELINWGYNMLAETDPNAVIFTAGDNDTYVAWMVQEAKGFRKDVRIVNMSLMMIDSYRDGLLKELGMKPMDDRLGDDWTHERYVEMREKILRHFMENNEKHPVYVAVSAVRNAEQFSDHLYVTGLCYKYSESSFDNIAHIVRNFEHRFLLDYLRMSFAESIGQSIVDQINGCYIPAMVQLYEYYRNSEQQERLAALKPLLVDVSRKAGQWEDVRKALNIEP